MISIYQQLEQARNQDDINLVRERIENEIECRETRIGYLNSCCALESVYDQDDLGSVDDDYDEYLEELAANRQETIKTQCKQGRHNWQHYYGTNATMCSVCGETE